MEEIKQQYAETPITNHYDDSKEVRAKGAGFYRFSGDEEERKRQMEALKGVREETVTARNETGALDVASTNPAEESTSKASRASEKRKRELEERRKMIDAKRRKLYGPEEEAIAPPPAKAALVGPPSAADDFLAKLEKEILGR